ncbi:MAG: hypothetical protein JWR09_5091 [Mucilaginibacter sp.]|nr:hypothetical protein [Mucilaginibacter sp.]
MANQKTVTNSGESTYRIVSLDVFRGLTIAGMILVTDPGTYSYIYPQLRHADWMGVTATDMIFPCFLFMVGVSIPMAFASRLRGGATRASLAWHIFRRAAILVVLGLAVNGFPFYNLHTLRLPGILQRIAICYVCSGLIYLYTDFSRAGKQGDGTFKINSVIAVITFILLTGYWAMLVWIPVPGVGPGHLDTFGNLPAYVDRVVIGINHMWIWGLTPGVGVTYDPEGILSTLPAIASTLIGVLAGEWMRTNYSGRRKAIRLILAGIVLVAAGLLLARFLPVNKRIWTSSFALLSSGVAVLLFSFSYIIVDLKQIRWWIFPALVLGTNAILAFVFSSVITSLSDLIHIHQDSGKSLTLHKFGNYICTLSGLSPINASLAYAIIIVLLNIALIIPFYKKKIFLKA